MVLTHARSGPWSAAWRSALRAQQVTCQYELTAFIRDYCLLARDLLYRIWHMTLLGSGNREGENHNGAAE